MFGLDQDLPIGAGSCYTASIGGTQDRSQGHAPDEVGDHVT